jgi:hypothetical protein
LTFDYQKTVSSALNALEVELGKKALSLAMSDEVGIALGADVVDRGVGGSSRSGRSRDKGKQKAASVSAALDSVAGLADDYLLRIRSPRHATIA